MSELVKCATCKTEKPFSEMQTCMHADREHSVCDMTCMINFYKGKIKPDIVITPDLEEMGKLGMNPKEYHLHKENLKLSTQLAKANERVRELEQYQLPIENGENRYGLDVSYFRNVINRELNRSLDNYKPDELARVLARISRTADKSVMFEPEFSNKFAIEQQRKGIEDYKRSDEFCRLLDSHFNSGKVYGHNEYYEQIRKEQGSE